jgi:hypothetical protein
MSKLNEANMADTIGGILALVGMGTGITAAALLSSSCYWWFSSNDFRLYYKTDFW